MSRRRMMGVYVQASTANPTGWRPWNSRLSYYIDNTFPLPTTGRGRWLLQPGVPNNSPAAAGGLGIDFPNFASFQGPRTWRTQVNPATPGPVYGPPPSARLMTVSGLGAINPRSGWQRAGIMPQPVVVSTSPTSSSSTSSGTQSRRGRGRWQQQGSSSNYEGWQGNAQGYPTAGRGQSYQSWLQRGLLPQASAAAGSGQIVGYDASGNPIYSSPPSGLTVVGTDAQGNPIYGQAGSTSSTAAASSSSNFLTEDSLGLGLPNIAYLGIGVALVFLLKKR